MLIVAVAAALPAAAEMTGTATCAQPSWSALASGDCAIGDLRRLYEPPRQAEPAVVVELVDDFAIPEPQTYALMLVGLVAVAAAAWRRRRRP
ncbi:MAG: PEP-CTERM sorting domain-containing protein [Burkholderiaceae bacterium]